MHLRLVLALSLLLRLMLALHQTVSDLLHRTRQGLLLALSVLCLLQKHSGFQLVLNSGALTLRHLALLLVHVVEVNAEIGNGHGLALGTACSFTTRRRLEQYRLLCIAEVILGLSSVIVSLRLSDIGSARVFAALARSHRIDALL